MHGGQLKSLTIFLRIVQSFREGTASPKVCVSAISTFTINTFHRVEHMCFSLKTTRLLILGSSKAQLENSLAGASSETLDDTM